MKIYDFTSKEREWDKVVFALILNKKRMTERIIIGKSQEVRRLLEDGDGEVYYDAVRPLGSLLFTFEADTRGDWNAHIFTLCESYAKIFIRKAERWKMTAPVSEFLAEKYKNGEPSAMFAAIRTWEEYLGCFNLNYGAARLSERLFTLYKPFQVYDTSKPWQAEAPAALSTASHDGESNIELWHIEEPSGRKKLRVASSRLAKPRIEVIVACSSFLPIIFYYMNKVEEWRLVFQRCKVCGGYFLARSRHYELCSASCRKLKAVEATREFNERAKNDECQKLYYATYQFWFNRLRKVQKSGCAACNFGNLSCQAEQHHEEQLPSIQKTAEAAAIYKEAFGDFRKEAKKRKAAVRSKEQLDDFRDWLFRQQCEAEFLLTQLIASCPNSR
ncbi:MAG: hypothetical protein FWG87_12620 [Defluviitaleaceae bacterium]|nr:hypothetical protein [Defluviitaleaceae bacterium]